MNSIQELITFFEAIPAENWTKGTLSSWAAGKTKEPEKNCAFGHLNKHLTGDWNYNISNGKADSWDVVASIGLNPYHIIDSNNHGPDDAKTNVINFLKTRIKEVA